jgi:hypothetical protein
MGSIGTSQRPNSRQQNPPPQQQQQLSPIESFRQQDGSGIDNVMQALRNMDTTNFDGD